MSMKLKWDSWAYGLVGGCIGGGASSLSVWLGMTAAKGLGMDVPTLNFKAMGVIFLAGVISHGVAFLAKSPLPAPSTGNTELFTNSPKPPTP